ncbi:MAG: N-acetyltransferase [Ruminococcus sp.]|nr:N-acetyltransferase [Ruminococcus sp.]
MIQQMQSFTADEIAVLEKSWRGRQILSYYRAYGASYHFCRFFRLIYPEGIGWMLLFNATLFVHAQDPIPLQELREFTAMHLPFRVECSQQLLPGLETLTSYQKLHRATFALTPSEPSAQFCEHDVDQDPALDTVYDILHEGFPNLSEHSLWLTDTSHRCRHGISRVLTYRNSSTVTLVYDWKDAVLVGQVATRVAQRGGGYARDFLRWIATRLANQGKHVALYALDIRISFYREIGFTEIDSEYVLERQDIPKEQQEKGALST